MNVASSFHVPDETGEDTKGDDTLDLPGAAKSVERREHSCSRKLSRARIFSSSVMYNLAERFQRLSTSVVLSTVLPSITCNGFVKERDVSNT